MSHGADRKQKVDSIAHRRMRELQVVRAEVQACRRTAENLGREMIEKRSALDAAVGEYGRRRTGLVDREAKAHNKLALILQRRSTAESALERVRDYVEGDLKARRTACTVRSYRLNARWSQLHDRYRGFVADVMQGGGTQQRSQQPDDGRRPAAATRASGRRFFAVADKFGARYRRESLRTSRSLHTLMAGYLRENSSAGDGGPRSPVPSSAHRQSLAALDGAEPGQVLDKLRVMQEQCARIAERVRRRTQCTPSDGDLLHAHSSETACDDGGDSDRLQDETLTEARLRLATGRDYVEKIRGLIDTAISDVRREQERLRKLLGKTCATCVGRKAQLDRSYTVVEIAGRLERACFALFARLDRIGADLDRGPTATVIAHDVVTSCLRAVQAQRAKAVHRARDVAFRVNDFHKAATRLLLATSTAKSTNCKRAAVRRKSKVSPT